jgi:hypothetical protein
MIVFLDIDGTCADATERFAKAGPEPASRGALYTRWLRRVQTPALLLKDTPVDGMASLAYAIHEWTPWGLVYLTGRSEVYREVTRKWLEDNGFPPCELLMRPKRNSQSNGILKEQLIKTHLKGEYLGPIIVMDDDYNGDIEKVCHQHCWTFLKAKSGGYWK